MFALIALLAALHLTAKDNGRAFTVKPAAAIVVTLKSNSSTGYFWKLRTPNPKALVFVSVRHVQPTGPPGTPGKDIWHFRALNAGNTARLHLVYIRASAPTKPA